MNKVIVFCIILIGACRSIRVFDKNDLVDFAEKREVPAEAKLKWSGYFNNVSRSIVLQKDAEVNGMPSLRLDSDRAKTVEIKVPVFFFLNGVFNAEDPVVNVDSLKKKYLSQKMYEMKSGYGLYTVHGDTITVLKYRYIQNRFRLPRWEDKLVMYQGTILNDSTIINWRQIPPYPNHEWDQIDTIPQRLVFQAFKGKNVIDSMQILNNLLSK
ncbi:MAG: hypothetical protein IT250_18470 [Chitinophagaceae bacterium]|nr:hypothetical protein [Chitinophagaceae bacterium]